MAPRCGLISMKAKLKIVMAQSRISIGRQSTLKILYVLTPSFSKHKHKLKKVEEEGQIKLRKIEAAQVG